MGVVDGCEGRGWWVSGLGGHPSVQSFLFCVELDMSAGLSTPSPRHTKTQTQVGRNSIDAMWLVSLMELFVLAIGLVSCERGSRREGRVYVEWVGGWA